MLYRFMLPDGQVHQGRDLRAIWAAHPEATITHEIETDATGVAVSDRRYTGRQNTPATEPQTYEEMTKTRLLELATERGIEGRSGMNKGELVAALHESDSAEPSTEAPTGESMGDVGGATD